MDYHTNALVDALRKLGGAASPAAVIRRMSAGAAVIDAELRATVLADIPAFSASANPDILPELAAHGAEHTREILRLLGGGRVGSFEFVRKHAQRRAEQRFPLEATLHAYRCGHKIFQRWLRESILAAGLSAEGAQRAVAAVADIAIEYTDAISTVAASAYAAHSQLLADVAGDQRAQLLSILLEGYDEADGRVAKILRDAGYLETRQAFCVGLARSVEPTEMLNPARARRLAESIDGAFRQSRVRRLIDLRDNKVTIVFSDVRRESGWTAPRSSLAQRVSTALALLGNAVLIGISNDVPSTSHIPSALKEATFALELATVAQRVVQFSAIPVQRLLLHLTGEEVRRVLPAWANELFLADDNANGALVGTLRAYASADMNVLKAAAVLTVHPNTIYARFQRILAITGVHATTYHGLSELLLVADCGRRSSGWG
jgi:hypothetical protein